MVSPVCAHVGVLFQSQLLTSNFLCLTATLGPMPTRQACRFAYRVVQGSMQAPPNRRPARVAP